MEQEVYTVNNAEMSAVFDFTSSRFIEDRGAAEKWQTFFANSLLSQRCVLHDFVYSGKTCKIRVKHSSEGKQSCQARSTLTIKRSDLDPNRDKFRFSNKPSSQPCTCKQVLDDETEAPGIDLNVCRVCLVSADQSKLSSLRIGGERAEIFSRITGISIAVDDDAMVCSEHSAVLDLLISFRYKSRYTNETYFNFNPALTEFVAAPQGSSQTLQIKTEFKTEVEDFDDAAEQDFDDFYSEISDSGDDAGFSQYNPLVVGPTLGAANKTTQQCGWKSGSDLRKHEVSHSEVRLFACWCGKAFKRKSHLTAHRQTHGELKAGGKYHCDICSRSYPTKSALAKDMQWHVRAGQATEDKLMKAGGLSKPFKCQEEGCDKTFRVRSELNKHASSHSTLRPFICWCGKGFKKNWHLSAHEKTHGNNREKQTHEKKIMCEQCSELFSTDQQLQRHLLLHNGSKPFPCRDCGREFRRKDKLRDHEKICKSKTNLIEFDGKAVMQQ